MNNLRLVVAESSAPRVNLLNLLGYTAPKMLIRQFCGRPEQGHMTFDSISCQL